jgi:hypothetical protein
MNDVTVGVPVCAGAPNIAAVDQSIARYDQARTKRARSADEVLAELDCALAEHGRPCPERTAAWLAAGAPVRP